MGSWKGGKQHGEGVIVMPDGEQKDGSWENGKQIR